MQFTVEEETDGTLPFLDTKSFTTRMVPWRPRYFVKAHIDRYLDFQSHHPMVQKVARNLLHQAEKNCTDIPD